MLSSATPAGNIYDLGYRRYDGIRKGRGYAIWALYLASLRSAFGMGRRPSSKIIPFALAFILLVPAVVACSPLATSRLKRITFVFPKRSFDRTALHVSRHHFGFASHCLLPASLASAFASTLPAAMFLATDDFGVLTSCHDELL